MRVHARQVVVAAGALRTPAVLQASGLDHPAIGRNLRLHPVAGLLTRMPTPVELWRGLLDGRAGRALVGYLAPANRHAEFFGLWGLAVKLASILGPLTYGAITWLTDNDQRTALLITGVFFVLGLVVLRTIDPERGRRAAVAAS